MRKYLLLFGIVLTLTNNSLFGQQHFVFKYKLNKSLNQNGELFEVIKGKKPEVKTWVGFVEANKILKNSDPNSDTLSIFTNTIKVEPEKRTIEKQIRGTVEINEEHDTLSITPWYSKKTDLRLKDKKGNPIAVNDENDYFFEIKNWDYTKIGGYPYVDVPFTYRQITATNLPLRANIKNGEVKGEFLNVNAAFFWIWGTTRFYQSKFVAPRNRYLGFGPYVGGSEIEEGDKKLFGVNYGVNGIFSLYNIQMILALGAETGIHSTANKFNPYIGLGLGVKLSDLYEPGNK